MSSPGAAAGVAVLAKRGRFLVAEPAFERGGNRITLDGKSTRGANVGDLVLLGDRQARRRASCAASAGPTYRATWSRR